MKPSLAAFVVSSLGGVLVRVIKATVLLLFALRLAHGQDFFVKDVRLFDGEHVIAKTSVLVRNGRIHSVGSSLRPPRDIQVIPGGGQTLLPGLIDSHTHIHSRRDMELSLIYGVTTDLSMLMDLTLGNALKAEQREDHADDRADLFSSGFCATAPGGHGTEYGLKFPTLTSPGEAQRWVDDRIAEGSDYIKIIYENGGDTGHGGRPSIDQPILQALVTAAHARGKLAVVHIHSEQQAIDALAANADGLAHAFLFGDQALDQKFLALESVHHAFIIPTFSVLESVCNLAPGQRLVDDALLSPYLMPADIVQLKKNINRAPAENCKQAMRVFPSLVAARVSILAGTDEGNLGTAAGVSLHGELEYLVEAGLTTEQALIAATSAPAAAFHLTDRGRIAPGLRADLLLVKGNPVKNIKDTRNIVAVWKDGVRLDREAWLRRAQAASSQPH